MKIERKRIHFVNEFSLPSPSSDLKVPIILIRSSLFMASLFGTKCS